MWGDPAIAADHGFSATVVEGLHSVRDTGVLHNRLGFLLTLNHLAFRNRYPGQPPPRYSGFIRKKTTNDVAGFCLPVIRIINRNTILPHLPNFYALLLQEDSSVLFMGYSE